MRRAGVDRNEIRGQNPAVSRFIQVHIVVCVEVDLERDRKSVVEIGSECWPHSACPEIWNVERETWEEARDWPAVTEAAHEFLEQALERHKQ